MTLDEYLEKMRAAGLLPLIAERRRAQLAIEREYRFSNKSASG